MSSKSSILFFNNGSHVYEECNEWDEKHKQYAIYWSADWADFKDVRVDENTITLQFNTLGFSYPLSDIEELQFDSYGFCFKIKCGTKTHSAVMALKDKEKMLSQ